MDHQSDAAQHQRPVNFIYAPATFKGVHQPSVVLQELRQLQFHDKSPLMNVLFHPMNVPFETNSIAWPSKYQAQTYLPPGEALSRLFIRSSPYVNPFDSFSRRYEISYGNNQNQDFRYVPQSHVFNNFVGNHQQPYHSNFFNNQHRYVIPQIPYFSSNVPLSQNFPPLPYVSPSLRGYKSETPGDIDVRMSNVSDDVSQLPEVVQHDSGLLNRAGSEMNVEITTQMSEIEQRNLEESTEMNKEEILADDNAPRNITASLIKEENTTILPTIVERTTVQSEENLIDATKTTATEENSSESSTDATTTTMNSDDELTTITELPETTTDMNSSMN